MKKRSKKASIIKETDMDNLFFASFVGEEVEIMCSKTIAPHNGLMLTGTLMDIDEVYYYLGDGKKVNMAINKEDVIVIEISKTMEDIMLNQVDIPEKAEDGN